MMSDEEFADLYRRYAKGEIDSNALQDLLRDRIEIPEESLAKTLIDFMRHRMKIRDIYKKDYLFFIAILGNSPEEMSFTQFAKHTIEYGGEGKRVFESMSQEEKKVFWKLAEEIDMEIAVLWKRVLKAGRSKGIRYKLFPCAKDEISLCENEEVKLFFYKTCPTLFRQAIRAEKTKEPLRWNAVATFGINVKSTWLPDVFLALRKMERHAKKLDVKPFIVRVKSTFETLRLDYHFHGSRRADPVLDRILSDVNMRLMRKGFIPKPYFSSPRYIDRFLKER